MRTTWGDEHYMVLSLMDGIWTDLYFVPQISQIIFRQIKLLLMDRMSFDLVSLAHPRSK
jgi:hypothetical protein